MLPLVAFLLMKSGFLQFAILDLRVATVLRFSTPVKTSLILFLEIALITFVHLTGPAGLQQGTLSEACPISFIT